MGPGTSDDTFWADEPSSSTSAMPLIGESAVPWLTASLVLGLLALALAVRGVELGTTKTLVLAVGLAGTMTAAALVVARSRQELEATVREERLRPALDQMGKPLDPTLTYTDGMQRWTGAVTELLEHALDTMEPEAPHRATIAAAYEETRDLNELFTVDLQGELPINDQAKLHAIGSLWETGQARIEEMAGAVDPTWYRQWRARVVADRQLRHGHDAEPGTPLPYRD
jgi:hypothetical protein